MRTGVRGIGLAAVLVVALMAATGAAHDVWDIRTTPDGCAAIAFVGLLVAWVGASLVLGGRRRRS